MQSLLGPFLIKTRLAEDLAAATPLPKHPFDPCVIDPAVGVDKYQTVAFDCNRYSVPRPFAHRMVTVKGYVDRVVLIAEEEGRRDARTQLPKADAGPRPGPLSRDAGPQAEPHSAIHGVPRLGGAGMLHRLPRRAGKLHGAMTGARRYVRVLQLLGEHPLTRVRKAIDACISEHLTSAEAVIQRTRSFATIEATTRPRHRRRSSKCPARLRSRCRSPT